MLDFQTYMMRHGESWIQEIIERVERLEGIRHNTFISLEERWSAVMHGNSQSQRLAA